LGTTYHSICSTIEKEKAGFFVLIDPDKISLDSAVEKCQIVEEAGADAILIGGSLLFSNKFDDYIQQVKTGINIPVIIFPGNSRQISPDADAILFLNFISSRNPNYLIGEQVIAAPIIKSMHLETISTGYMHIESGNLTTVEFLSGSRSIPRDKVEIAIAHALAAEYMGMKLVYLEAGSGAVKSIPNEMIKQVTRHVSVPVVVGGGIKSPSQAQEKVQSGAKIVVIGNFLEKKFSQNKVKEFSDAIHGG
jgi:putative glycerol-1-phosphate prenyltransferase